jgi:hypothetical protein
VEKYDIKPITTPDEDLKASSDSRTARRIA